MKTLPRLFLSFSLVLASQSSGSSFSKEDRIPGPVYAPKNVDPFVYYRDKNGEFCCNRNDCVYAYSCKTIDGSIGWWEMNKCNKIPDSKIRRAPAEVWKHSEDRDVVVCRKGEYDANRDLYTFEVRCADVKLGS